MPARHLMPASAETAACPGRRGFAHVAHQQACCRHIDDRVDLRFE